MRKRTLNKSKRDEKGQALIVVLILMLLGGLIIAPLLAYMGTGIKVGKEVFEERMYGQYAADSGVEDALYKIRVDDPALPPEWEGAWTTGDPYDTPYGPPEYPPFQLNGNDVQVTIQPQWALLGLEDPPPGMTPHADMVVVGDTIETSGDGGEYQISITYNGEVGQLFIERIGVWLPAGCDYAEGTSNLEQADPSEKYHCVPVSQPYRGGEAIIWNFSPPRPKFTDFPGEGNKRVVTFEFIADQPPYSAFSWVVSQSMDIYLSWDVDIKIFKITSQATDIDSGKSVAVEAFTAKNEMRELGSAILGDYCAVGGTLLTATDEEEFRDRLFMESSATVTDADIPTSATVEAAYLYWSGWIDYHYKYQDEYGSWHWETIDELKYPADPTLENLEALVEGEAKVNRVSFGIIGNMTEITTDEWQAEENIDQADTWSYSCFYNATDLIKSFIETGEIAANGVPSVDGKYTLSHVPEDRVEFFYDLDPSGDTGYPLGTPATRLDSESYLGRYEWAYAGWSLIIIYSSAETKGHQLYLYDDFAYAAEVSNVDFDNDGEDGGTISGFLAPEEIIDEDYAAKLTCFVGEGDEVYPNDYIKVKGETGTETYLSNVESPTNNVWNSKYPGFEEDGIDIDTFEIQYPAIRPGDTSAQVDLPTDNDSWNLVYIILSFRSEVTTGGAITYIYVGGG